MTGVEGIGAASGLFNLFNAAITWFDYILVAKEAATRLESLLLRLQNAQLRLTRWGNAAGLTDSLITDEESMKSSSYYQLDKEQEEQAIKTFRVVGDLFERCQKLCEGDRKSTSKIDSSAEEISPFDPKERNWNPMRQYLHNQMRRIIHGRKLHVPVTQRLKFAFYKKEHLEGFIKDINDHIDDLYKIFPPPDNKQESLGKGELDQFLEVMNELGAVSERDTLLHSAVQSILNQKNEVSIRNQGRTNVAQQGVMSGGTNTMNVNEKSN